MLHNDGMLQMNDGMLDMNDGMLHLNDGMLHMLHMNDGWTACNNNNVNNVRIQRIGISPVGL